VAQDDYYYEIQLSNKQLVFYFMAGATGLILSFLAGVMVGRGVDASAGDVQAARGVPVQEDKVVAEEVPARPAPPATQDLTYAQRLEGEKQDESLEKPKAAPKAAPTPAKAVVIARPATAAPPSAKKTEPPPAAKSAAMAKAVAPSAGNFTIQVGAFKDKASADSVVSRLKGKGFAAYAVSPGAAEGLFNVRVGSYVDRVDAEQVQVRLRDEEKFKPFIVKN